MSYHLGPKTTLRTLFFALALFLFGCQKEVSEEHLDQGGTGNSTAVFSLVPTSNNCSDAVVSGTFVAGTALTATSMITVTVNVTTIGGWQFSTNTVNGYSFRGTGTFTQTGNQSIQLLATGTPAAAGNNNFNLNTGSSICTVAVTVNAAGSGGGGNVGNATLYYKATIDGVAYSEKVTDTNSFIAGSGLSGSDDVIFGGGIAFDDGNGVPKPPTATSLDVDIGVLHNYYNCTDAYFRAFFTIGDHAYAKPNPMTDADKEGVVVVWGDASGGYWSSQAGTGSQTGSTFKIISVEDARDITGTLYLKIKMQFSCKIYNVNTGAAKTLTNGEMVAYFGKI
ncbi:hypothetical protein [Pinibacter soli]|uniref:Lipoprotein n=1 Tax=Pinibacter soli TaxID=3044211 RepID=A0ABT6R877_9BACT|nr:hypothetical protein [Pinibacter soli]MDI3318757.1 hypothetical protein [Pinibacter soli]